MKKDPTGNGTAYIMRKTLCRLPDQVSFNGLIEHRETRLAHVHPKRTLQAPNVK